MTEMNDFRQNLG